MTTSGLQSTNHFQGVGSDAYQGKTLPWLLGAWFAHPSESNQVWCLPDRTSKQRMIRGNNRATINPTKDENVILIFTELRFRGHWTYLIYMHALWYHQMARHCVAMNATRFNLPLLEQTWKHVRCKHESGKHRSSPFRLKIRCVSFGFFGASQFLASKLFCEFAQKRIHISEY